MVGKNPLTEKNPYGQYFTPDHIASFMINLSKIDSESTILEPCCGEGVFLSILEQKGFKKIVAYEIDKSLNNPNYVINESFVSAKIDQQFDLIIGNPPYIRWKNLEDELKEELSKNSIWNTYCNSLCDYLYIFILKSIMLLKDGGELIFICPEFWTNTTHSVTLRNYMMSHGYFADIIHFSESKVFNNVNSSIMIFRYIKGKNPGSKISITKVRGRSVIDYDKINQLANKEPIPDVDYFEIEQFKQNSRWVLEKKECLEEIELVESNCNATIESICDIGNGMVSGLDTAFQIDTILNEEEEKMTRNVIKGKDLNPYTYKKITKYIFIDQKITEDDLIEKYPHFYQQLLPYKEELTNRYQYNKHFDYWEWVFPRNYNLLSRNEKRIFVPCKERISNKDYFRFAIVEPNIYSTQDVTALFKKKNVKESIEYIVAYLNNPHIFTWISLKGIVKGNVVEFSETPLNSIPFRTIDWDDPREVAIHNSITEKVKMMIDKNIESDNSLSSINDLFEELFFIKKRSSVKVGQNRLSDFGIVDS